MIIIRFADNESKRLALGHLDIAPTLQFSSTAAILACFNETF